MITLIARPTKSIIDHLVSAPRTPKRIICIILKMAVIIKIATKTSQTITKIAIGIILLLYNEKQRRAMARLIKLF